MYEFNTKYLLIVIASFLFISCKSQVVKNDSVSKIKVEFVVNDSLCLIDSAFSITIKKSNDSVLYSSNMTSDSLFIPDSVWGAADYLKVAVNYKSYLLSFDTVSSKMTKPTEGMEWKFGVEKRPFLTVGSVIHPNMIKNDTDLKAIYFWKLRPYEGHGRQIIKKVY
jgi:hypothetical protein